MILSRIISVLFAILLVSHFDSKAQDPHFSQYYAAPIFLGPSLAGSTQGMRAAINFRDQWPQIPGTYITGLVSFDGYLPKSNSGIGVYMLRDYAGSGKITYTNTGIAYSYNIPITKRIAFIPGVMPNFFQKSINYNEIYFSDQIIDGEVSGQTIEELDTDNPWHFDFTVSGLVYTKDYWVGTSLDHLMKLNNRFKEDQTYMPFKYSIYGGYKISFSTEKGRRNGFRNNLYATSSYKRQDKVNQFDVGAYLQRSVILLGLWYRATPFSRYGFSQDALILLVGYQNKKLKVGYSYDYTLSHLITNTGGAHEVSLIFTFAPEKTKQKKTKRYPIPCPQL